MKANATIGGKTYNITKKATLNNKDYYLISDYNGNTSRGWVPLQKFLLKLQHLTKLMPLITILMEMQIFTTHLGNS